VNTKKKSGWVNTYNSSFYIFFYIRIRFRCIGGTVDQNMHFRIKVNLKEIYRTRVN